MRRVVLMLAVLLGLGIFGVVPARAIYVDNGDTVTDTYTGLEWQQATAPGITDGKYNWDQAMQYGENLTLDNKSDWRLPTREELLTLVKIGQAPAIDTVFFPDTTSSNYWSSATYAVNTDLAWCVNFLNGYEVYPFNKSLSYYVRAVRGGQSESLRDLVISLIGPGSGSVASSPAGIACGADCAETYHYNNTITLTATPDPGSTFIVWIGDADCADGVVTMTADVACAATFAVSTQTLTYTAGANGTISGTSPQTVTYGASGAAVTAVPEANYHFVQWSDGISTTSRTDSNVTGDITVTAQFALNTYTLSYTAPANGTISGADSQTVNHGGSGIAVTAIPAANYHFVQWSDGISTASRTDSNVTGNITVTAQFALNAYTLTYTAGANGTISGTTSQTVNHSGSGTAVTAVPAASYHFVQWSDGISTASRTDSNVTGNITVTAQFALNTYTLTYTAPANGTISGTDSQTVNHGGSGTAVTAVPAANYHFVQWSDGISTASRTDSNVMGNITVTAQFALNTFTLSYTAGANGTISGTTTQTVNHDGSGTAVTAVPTGGYAFVKWSDNSTANPRTDNNVTGDITVTAQFSSDISTVTSSAGAHGAISPLGSQTLTHGTAATFTVTPDPGYSTSVGGSCGGVLAGDIYTTNAITADCTVVAAFYFNAHGVTASAGAHGTISPLGAQAVIDGQDASFTVTPEPGYIASVGGTCSGVLAGNSYTTAAVTNDCTVAASFSQMSSILTYSAGVHGAISGDTEQTVSYGADGTAVTAMADAEYRFLRWSDGATANPRLDSSVTADIAVTAIFGKKFPWGILLPGMIQGAQLQEGATPAQ